MQRRKSSRPSGTSRKPSRETTPRRTAGNRRSSPTLYVVVLEFPFQNDELTHWVQQDSIAALAEKVPNGAIIYGAAGLVPYAATSFASVYLSKQAGSPTGTFDTDTALALLHHVEGQSLCGSVFSE